MFIHVMSDEAEQKSFPLLSVSELTDLSIEKKISDTVGNPDYFIFTANKLFTIIVPAGTSMFHLEYFIKNGNEFNASSDHRQLLLLDNDSALPLLKLINDKDKLSLVERYQYIAPSFLMTRSLVFKGDDRFKEANAKMVQQHASQTSLRLTVSIPKTEVTTLYYFAINTSNESNVRSRGDYNFAVSAISQIAHNGYILDRLPCDCSVYRTTNNDVDSFLVPLNTFSPDAEVSMSSLFLKNSRLLLQRFYLENDFSEIVVVKYNLSDFYICEDLKKDGTAYVATNSLSF